MSKPIPITNYCTICMSDIKMDEERTLLQCRHAYHKTCITKWIDIDILCPICKAVMSDNDVNILEGNEVDIDPDEYYISRIIETNEKKRRKYVKHILLKKCNEYPKLKLPCPKDCLVCQIYKDYLL